VQAVLLFNYKYSMVFSQNITKSKDSPVRGEIRKKDASNTSEKKKRFGKFKVRLSILYFTYLQIFY